MSRYAFACACFLAGLALTVSAATIASLKLSDGYDDSNRIAAPVYDAQGVSLELTAAGAAKPKAKFVRRTGGRLPATRGPEYDLDPRVDLAGLLTEALRSEAQAMGLNTASRRERHWRVGMTIKDVYLESRQVYMGATLFYGYMDLDVLVNGPAGENRTIGMRVHSYSGSYNAGLGRRDEAEGAAARLFVEGAQDVVARLNRDVLKAPPAAGVAGRIAAVQSGALKEKLGDLRAVALSGAPAAAPVLLGLLAKEEDEDLRSALIDSLGHLGSAEVVTALATRYGSEEEEDVRWHTLKALDYIGGAEAQRVIAADGLRDEDGAPKRLAGRISGR